MTPDELIARREERGLSQDRLADLSGVSRSTIRNIEAGRHEPYGSTVRRLEEVLGRSRNGDGDPELVVLSRVVDLLEAMTGAEQQRSLRYLNDRYRPSFDDGGDDS